MTPEELNDFEYKLSALRTHGNDSEYVREIDPFLDPLVKALREAWVELGEALDELAFIKEEYGDGDPAEMTADALLLKVKTLTLDYNKARAEVERLKVGRDYDAKVIPDLMRELEEAKLLLSVKIGTVEAQRQLLADNGALLIESKAEVERLKAKRLEDARWIYETGQLVKVARNERNEAQAEVERLRSALRLLWEEAQDKAAIRDETCDAVEAALKEGGHE